MDSKTGGSGLNFANDIKIGADVCITDENAKVYNFKYPVCDNFISVFVPIGKISKDLGRKLINEVLVLDIKTSVPILSIQEFNDETEKYKVKVKTMNVKNHTNLRRKVGYQIIKYNACRSCRKCESLCSFGAISINNSRYKINESKCKHCQKCVSNKYIAGGRTMKRVLFVSKKEALNNAKGGKYKCLYILIMLRLLIQSQKKYTILWTSLIQQVSLTQEGETTVNQVKVVIL